MEFGGGYRAWKKGNVTLVFKKGKQEDLGNYSLFSITLVLGKVSY